MLLEPRSARRVPAIAVVALAFVALTACGSKDHPSASGSSTTTTSGGSSTSATTGTTAATGTTATTVRPADRTDCAVANGHEVTIEAKGRAWTMPCLQAPEGVQLTILVKNDDAGVKHNVRVTGLPGRPASPATAGPVTERLDLGSSLTAGSYAYVCDIYPTMTGSLDVLSPLPEGTVSPAQ